MKRSDLISKVKVCSLMWGRRGSVWERSGGRGGHVIFDVPVRAWMLMWRAQNKVHGLALIISSVRNSYLISPVSSWRKTSKLWLRRNCFVIFQLHKLSPSLKKTNHCPTPPFVYVPRRKSEKSVMNQINVMNRCNAAGKAADSWRFSST